MEVEGMPDDKQGQFPTEDEFGDLGGSDSGLGNLPPLSDFDSSEGEEKAGKGLPPMGGKSSSGGLGSLPPISDIPLETPEPSGGNIKPTPRSFGDASGDFETPISDLDSPVPSQGGTGFQDLAADSDFSPETPEIGPGPDSDIETPMFDSAFGAGGTFDSSGETPAPTQAMETPVFGMGGGDFDTPGFDEGAFGGAAPPPRPPAAGSPFDRGFDAGTPVPDFSPDTGVPTPGGPTGPPPQARKGGGKGGFGGGLLAVAAIIALIIGLIIPSFVSIPFLPNAAQTQVEQLQTENTSLQTQVRQLQSIASASDGAAPISEAELSRLREEMATVSEELTNANMQRDQIAQELAAEQEKLELVRRDIEEVSAEYIDARDSFENVSNETAIQKARQEGLLAEVSRLTDQVGDLEAANTRRVASLDALRSDVERLAVLVKEGMPLTPAKFSRDERLARVEQLLDRANNAKWVDPELLKEYTSLYQRELQIAASSEYFFAKIPVNDEFGNRVMKWAECLMNGNWSVYYRTLDGKNIGVFENVGEAGRTEWGFVESLPPHVKKEIELTIFASRVPDFEEKLAVIAGKENLTDSRTGMQRVFDSL
jgi:uncharacterized membrane-anchored protein YhcB (DUF1043 family)